MHVVSFRFTLKVRREGGEMSEVASGWYADPNDSSQLRFWDGSGWTSNVRVNPAAKAESKALKARERADSKAAAKEQEAAAKAKPAEQAAQYRAHHVAQFGNAVADEIFAEWRIVIYRNGYIGVGTFKPGTPERLLGFETSADITKKSGLGRSVATLATFATPFPAFNLLSPNRRGDLTITYTTPEGTRTILTKIPRDIYLEAMRSLQGAANAVMKENDRADASDSIADAISERTMKVAGVSASGGLLSEELKALSDLHQSGALTDSEYSTAKAKLLSSD